MFSDDNYLESLNTDGLDDDILLKNIFPYESYEFLEEQNILDPLIDVSLSPSSHSQDSFGDSGSDLSSPSGIEIKDIFRDDPFLKDHSASFHTISEPVEITNLNLDFFGSSVVSTESDFTPYGISPMNYCGIDGFDFSSSYSILSPSILPVQNEENQWPPPPESLNSQQYNSNSSALSFTLDNPYEYISPRSTSPKSSNTTTDGSPQYEIEVHVENSNTSSRSSPAQLIENKNSRDGKPNKKTPSAAMPGKKRGRKELAETPIIPQRCPFPNCDKVYIKSSHLKAHIRRHTGEKPFICNWNHCHWRFSRSDELGRHLRSHTGEKPYGCLICSKKFARSDHLSKHRKVHERSRDSYEFIFPLQIGDNGNQNEIISQLTSQQQLPKTPKRGRPRINPNKNANNLYHITNSRPFQLQNNNVTKCHNYNS